MAQQQQQRLTECNRCKANGFSGVMISFQRTNKSKPNGQPIWLLLNPDGSGHTHLEPGTAQSNIADRIDVQTKPSMQHNIKVVDRTIAPNQDTFTMVLSEYAQAIREQTKVLTKLTTAIDLLTVSLNNRPR